MNAKQKQQSILIISDAQDISILSKLLIADYQINIAINNETALKIINSEEPPHLILLDLTEIDGYGLCRRLKEDEKTNDIPIIFIISKTENEIKGFEVGAVDYITKPFNPVIAKTRIKTHLELKMKTNLLKKLYAKAKEEKDFMESIIENVPFAIYTTNINGVINSVNSAMKKLLDYNTETLLGKNVFELDSIKNSKMDSVFKETLQTGKSFYFENLEFQSYLTSKKMILNVNVNPIFRNKEIAGLLIIQYDNTEKFKVFQSLKLEKEFSKNILAYSPAGIHVINKDGKLIYANEASRAIGGSIKKIIGLDWINNAYVKKVGFDQNFYEALKGKTLYRENVPFLSYETKTEQVVNIRFIPIPNEDNVIENVLLMWFDNTEKYKSDLALKEEKDFVESIIENAPFAIYTTDINGVINSVNSAMKKLLDYNTETLLGMNVFELDSIKNSKMDSVFKETLQTGKSFYFENLEFQSSLTSKKMILNVNVNPIFRNKQIAGLLISQYDNTEKFKVFQSLKLEKEFSKNILAYSPAGIHVINKDGKLIYANQASRAIGGSVKKIIGLDWINNAYVKKVGFDQNFYEALKGKTLYRENVPFLSYETKTEQVVNIRFIPIPNEDNVIENVLLMWFDNTEKYKSDLALKEAKDHAEEQVIQRTKELSDANTRMKNELKMAKKIQETIIPKIFPDLKMLNLGGVYLPMDDLGGDYYDVFKLSEKKIGIVIVDVSGHGVSAALITTMAKMAFNIHSSKEISTSEIVKEVNKKMYSIIGELKDYLTAFYGIFDIETGIFEFTNAGHTPALLYRKNKKSVELLDAKGFFIGIIETAKYEARTVKVEIGDKILFYTDGISEARNNKDEMYGLERLKISVTNNGDNLLKDFTEFIVKDVVNFRQNRPFGDDIALLCIEYGA